jgi:hypothetical protein
MDPYLIEVGCDLAGVSCFRSQARDLPERETVAASCGSDITVLVSSFDRLEGTSHLRNWHQEVFQAVLNIQCFSVATQGDDDVHRLILFGDLQMIRARRYILILVRQQCRTCSILIRRNCSSRIFAVCRGHGGKGNRRKAGSQLIRPRCARMMTQGIRFRCGELEQPVRSIVSASRKPPMPPVERRPCFKEALLLTAGNQIREIMSSPVRAPRCALTRELNRMLNVTRCPALHRRQNRTIVADSVRATLS